MDQLAATYDVSRNSRRWPLTIFFTILNTAAINAEVVYRNNNDDYKMTRREFLKSLGKQLVEHQLSLRQNIMPRALRNPPVPRLPPNNAEAALPKKRRCEVCPRQSDRKSQYFCTKCGKTICIPHSVMVCQNCNNNCQSSESD